MADEDDKRKLSDSQQKAIDALESMGGGTFKDEDEPVDLGDAKPRVRFVCSGCGKKMKAPPEMVGTDVKCPKCGEKTKVPPALE
jgi:DNA-directed RNA polymerase subunit RPC12/RpoP